MSEEREEGLPDVDSEAQSGEGQSDLNHESNDPYQALEKNGNDVINIGTFNRVIPRGREPEYLELRQEVEPWLSALFQSEHLSLLGGSGLSIAVSENADSEGLDMGRVEFGLELEEVVNRRAEQSAVAMGRGAANIEDQIRSASNLIEGLETLGHDYRPVEGEGANEWCDALNDVLANFAQRILETEQGIRNAVESENRKPIAQLVSFLLSFSSRLPSRDRLHIFTTNYDRVLEWGCDRAGIKLLDQFVGLVQPRFRASRLNLDYHYNPPGIRGEPRYVEGVARFTKLHGSVDWADTSDGIVRIPVPFGPSYPPNQLPDDPLEALMIYPNASKDIETAYFPYSELLRDFSEAICRPNTVLVTYGYGFGDSHINRVIQDMLAIPSTHLLIISYTRAEGRISRFLAKYGRDSQTSFMVGRRIANLEDLVKYLLPKPAIDFARKRRAKLLEDRGVEPPVREELPEGARVGSAGEGDD